MERKSRTVIVGSELTGQEIEYKEGLAITV